jgi:ATP-dependent Clp protease adaptor protein ClpS
LLYLEKMPPQATPDIIEQTEVETELAQVWKVIVLNDPVNLMNYVVMVFRKVFGYGEQKAIKHMKEVHELGKSVLWTGEREQAESYVFQLQKWRLQAVLEKDD